MVNDLGYNIELHVVTSLCSQVIVQWSPDLTDGLGYKLHCSNNECQVVEIHQHQ